MPSHSNYVVYSQAAPTKLQGRKYILKSSQEIHLKGSQPPRHRKELIITNRDPSLRLQLRRAAAGTSTTEDDNDAEFIATIWPHESFRLETNSEVWVRNGNAAGAIELNVAEVFYE